MIGSVQEKVDKFNRSWDLSSMMPAARGGSAHSARTGAGSGGSGDTRRIACKPVFKEDELPVDIEKVGLPTRTLSRDEFLSTMELPGFSLFLQVQ